MVEARPALKKHETVTKGEQLERITTDLDYVSAVQKIQDGVTRRW